MQIQEVPTTWAEFTALYQEWLAESLHQTLIPQPDTDSQRADEHQDSATTLKT